MIDEQWIKIKNYEDFYEISNHGRIRSLSKNIVMKQMTHYKGYKFVHLYINKKRKKFFIHVLVASHFIPNPDNKKIVNHIDENKKNNHITNLEWMTSGENTRYYHLMRKKEKNL